MRARALVLLALLAFSARAATPALAQADGAWAFTITLDEPTASELRIDARARGVSANATLARLPANLTLDEGGDAMLDNGTLLLAPRDGLVRFSYRVPIARDQDRFLLVRLADVLPGGVEGAADAIAPAGWSAVSSRAIDGVVAFSSDLVVEQREIANATVRIAATSAPPSDDWAYFARAYPYLSLRHSALVADLLVLHAPGVRDAFLAGDAIVVPAEGDAEALARSFVRMHQIYRVVEVAPASAAWFREGEERYHALATLLAAGLRSASEVDESITRARAVGDPDATLPRAPAGSTTARQKGLVVVRALDAELRDASGGAASLADLVLALENDTQRFDSVGIEVVASAIAGASLAPFFEAYVYGTAWPDTAPVGAAPDVVVTRLALDPARVAQGQSASARYEVVNLGTRAGSLDVPLALDGIIVARASVSLDVGGRAAGTLALHPIVPGDHVVTMGARSATLRVLTPPHVRLDHASTTPDRPAAGQAFQLLVYVRNEGESPGHLRVEVHEAGALLGRTSDAVVAGSSTDALTIPLRLEDAGLHVLDIRIIGEEGGRIQHEIEVQFGAAPSRETPLPFADLFALLAFLAVWRRKHLHGTA